jgi:hypothetical protein
MRLMYPHPARPLAMAMALAGAVACQSAPPDPPPSYVPAAVFAYDGQYLDGSFEGTLGSGWDQCFTRTPEVMQHMTAGGSHGPVFLAFQSGGCSGVCAPDNPSSSQLYAWFSRNTNTSEPMGLYFDVANMAAAEPTGTLSFFGTDGVCEKETLFADIPLDRLQLTSGWTTRCVNIVGSGAHAAIGVSITGGVHHIGLDALRLGPTCHGS